MKPISALQLRGWPLRKKNWIGLKVIPTIDLKSKGGTIIKRGELCVVTGYYRGVEIRTVKKMREEIPTHDSMSRVRPGELEIQP